MKITGVTFTGADGLIDPHTLLEISEKYPWVEWGILLSPKRSFNGEARYPTLTWISKLNDLKAKNPNMKLAAHICGGWARDIITGKGISDYVTGIISNFDRWQINANFQKTPPAAAHYWVESKYILQFNASNREFIVETWQRPENPNAPIPHILEDRSGGRGIAPKEWPHPLTGFPMMGYAGGISPDNAAHVAETISGYKSKDGQTAWLDMEAGVRDSKDRFDLFKVGLVIGQVQKYIAP